MWAKALGVVGVALLCCLGTVGCASGGGSGANAKLPAYTAPNLTAAQAATIKGHGGTYITAIDGAKVSTGLQLHNFGGNEVLVTPGRHRIVAKRARSSSMSVNSKTVAFEHDFQTGHTYEVGPRSAFSTGMTLHNKTTDAKTAVD